MEYRVIVREHRWLVLAVLLAAATSAAITSCGGGGGGSSNGALCDQCGDTDGPCQPTALIDPSAEKPVPCPTPPAASSCESRQLICRRKVDSSQQRCFPANQAGTDVESSFRCDGSRPGATLPPSTVTPTPATPVPTPTTTPDPNAICGNGIIEGTEVCDNLNHNGKTCGDFCSTDGGRLLCIGCLFDVSQCTGLACSVR